MYACIYSSLTNLFSSKDSSVKDVNFSPNCDGIDPTKLFASFFFDRSSGSSIDIMQGRAKAAAARKDGDVHSKQLVVVRIAGKKRTKNIYNNQSTQWPMNNEEICANIYIIWIYMDSLKKRGLFFLTKKVQKKKE